jgi:protocatechuate 3,4-dioxygenase beta subunit
MKPSISPVTPPRRSFGAWLPVALLALLAGALGLYLLRGREKAAPARLQAAAVKGTYKNRALLRRPSSKPNEEPDYKPAISGTVYDTTGALLAGATVVAATFDVAGNIPSVVGEVRSDDQGRFEIPLPEGTYQVNASLRGYGPTTASVQSGELVSLFLSRSGAVKGRVVDDRGKPVRRFTIDVVSVVPGDAPAAPPLSSTTFDSRDGTFRIDALPQWPVVLRASAPDHAPGFSSPIQSKPGDEREVELAISEGCVLTGTVVDRAGSPLGRVLVNAEERLTAGSIQDPTIQAASQAQTEEDGSFRIEHVPVGTILLRGYDGDYAVSTATIEIKDCGSLTPAKLVMSAGGRIAGVAKRSDGAPIAGARLTVTDRSVGIANTMSDDQGRFHFDALPPGVIRLELAHEGQSALSFVLVKDGQTTTQDMTLFADGQGEIRGRVVAGTKPMAGARLLVASNHGRAQGIAMYFPVTGEDGTFRVPTLPKGAYLITVMSTLEGRGVQVKSDEITNVDLDVGFVPGAGDPNAPPPTHKLHGAITKPSP